MGAKTAKLSRRQVLGMAAGGAAAAVGLRALTLHSGNNGIGASAAGANGSWQSPLGDGRALAAHLLRRAGIAYTQDELDKAAGIKYADLVDEVINQKPQSLPLPSGDITKYTTTTTAWYQQMATTSAQFPERMALFWHGVLTSDYRKGGNTGPLVWQQNQLYRTVGVTDWRSLLVQTTYDPLMANYLDLVQSTGKSPNENYARELMELYTLGVGNYTESDVREGAKALTGVAVRIVDADGNPVSEPKRDKNNPQVFYKAVDQLAQSGAVWEGYLSQRRHDQGSKTYLGQTGNFTPDDVIDIILAQPAAATFLATKALTYFSEPAPSTSDINAVATAFRTSKYDIKTLMRTIFTSDSFTAAANYRSLVRSPADYMVATMRALGQAKLAPQAVQSGQPMDQILYDPPTVGGWPLNAGWVSSSSWLARLNFAAYMVQNTKNLPDPGQAVKTLLDNVVSNDTAAVYNASNSDADRWYAILSSAEFQLK